MTLNLEGVFICDLGLAKLRDAAQATMTTSTQQMIGTYPYMAPEMFSISHRSAAVDIYSLGCLYIELLARKEYGQQQCLVCRSCKSCVAPMEAHQFHH